MTRKVRHSACRDCCGKGLSVSRMMLTMNVWHGLASTDRRHYPNAPTAPWSARRWQGAAFDKLSVVPTNRGDDFEVRRAHYRFLFVGLRFSMNAVMPSERSSSAKVE